MAAAIDDFGITHQSPKPPAKKQRTGGKTELKKLQTLVKDRLNLSLTSVTVNYDSNEPATQKRKSIEEHIYGRIFDKTDKSGFLHQALLIAAVRVYMYLQAEADKAGEEFDEDVLQFDTDSHSDTCDGAILFEYKKEKYVMLLKPSGAHSASNSAGTWGISKASIYAGRTCIFTALVRDRDTITLYATCMYAGVAEQGLH